MHTLTAYGEGAIIRAARNDVLGRDGTYGWPQSDCWNATLIPHENDHLKYAFVGPALLLLIALNIFPLFYSLFLSFTNAELSGGAATFIGTANYSTVFSTPRFATAMRTTATFVCLAVAIEVSLGYALALCFRAPFRGKSVMLAVLLVPMMLSPAVVGLYWNVILNGNYGILNQILGALGAGQPQWLTDPDLKLYSLLLIDVWMWTPFAMLISLAGLNAIPGHLYEAAQIDRASRWTVFRRITLPLSFPLVALAALFRTTDALKLFDQVMAVTGPNDEATQTLSALLYQIIFRNYKMGQGSAYAMVVLVIVIALSTIFVRHIQTFQTRHGRAA